MGFRVVVVSSKCKIDFRLNYLIVRGEKERHIFINEINTIIVQSTAVSMTAALMCELVKSGVKIIFCDEKHNPISELLPYYGAHNCSKRYKSQINWSAAAKRKIWKAIITRKILNQAAFLSEKGFEKESKLLEKYSAEITDGDETNREGFAAKVYFNCLLPDGVSRNSGGFVNGCLNYGYAILLSAFNREIVACGYLTQLGIWHDNEFNQFNLSSDLMEPLRSVVDRLAFSIDPGDKEFKLKLANILNYDTFIDGKATTLDIAVRYYVRSVIFAIESCDETKISFPDKVIQNDEL